MWIIMKKTYSGPLGLYPKGMKYDLPERIVEQLPKRSYAECKAPWEEHTDTEAIELAVAKKTAENNLALVKMLESAIEKAEPKVAELTTIAEEKEAEVAEVNKAYNTSVKAAEKKAASEHDKAEAFRLANEANKKDLELQEVQGQLLAATAKMNLFKLELAEARRAAGLDDGSQKPETDNGQQSEETATEVEGQQPEGDK